MKLKNVILLPLVSLIILVILIVLFNGIIAKPCNYSSQVNTEEFEQYSPVEILDEYYNLIGTKEYAIITPRNTPIKNFFGIKNGCGNYSKTDLIKPSDEEILKKKSIIANYYLQDESLPDSQRNFLFWHFSSPPDYSNSTTTFPHEEPDYVIGWNSNITTNKFDKIYTFGLLGCTFIVAYSDNGNISVSHYDMESINPLQVETISNFSKHYKISNLYIIGFYAKKYYNLINETTGYNIFLHEDISPSIRYSISISKNTNKNNLTSPIIISYSSLPITSTYIPSIHNGDYGKYFSEGNASEIFPRDDKEFRELKFTKM